MYAKSNAQQNRRTLLPRPTVQLQNIALTMKPDNKSTTPQKNDNSIGTQSKLNKQQSNSDKRFQHNVSKSSNSGKSSPISIKKIEKNEEKNAQNGISGNNSDKDKPVNEKDANVESVKEVKDNKELMTDPGRKEALDKDNNRKQSVQKQSEQVNEEGKQSEEEPEKKENHKETADPAKKGKDPVDAENKKDAKQEKKLEKEDREKNQTVREEKKEEQEKQHEQIMSEKLEENQDDLQAFQDTSMKDTPHDETVGRTTRSMSVEIIEESRVDDDQEEERTATISSPKEPDQMRSTFTSNQSVTASTVTTIKSTTTTIDVEDMEPPSIDATLPSIDTTSKQTLQSVVEKESPMRKSLPLKPVEANPTTSTPGKFLNFREFFSTASPKASHKVDRQLSDISTRYPQSFTQISGRRSIRAHTDSYTPSHFQNNLYRESYRRINTELDASSATNTSLNVTVGSEIPNNSSFSFFGRGRKREPENQSAIDIELENSLKSPKRARMDMHGLLSVVASPLSLLRSRFSKTTIQSSTSSKPQSSKQTDDEVLNVSGASIEENVEHAASANNSIANEDLTVGNDDDEDAEEEKDDNSKDESTANAESSASSASGGDVSGESMEVDDNQLDDKVLLKKCSAEEIIDRDNKGTDSETLKMEQCGAPSKNKRCNVM